MISLVVWCLMIYGMCNIAVYGSILDNFRNTIQRWGNNPRVPFNGFFHFIREMLRCMMCSGFHIGYLVSFLIYSPVHEFLQTPHYLSWFLDGCLASGTTWIINSVVEWFEENRPNNNINNNINNNQIL